MMPSELHPEEMLDAARGGALSSRVAIDLRAHLKRCAACRLHLELADDLAVDGRVSRLDGILLARMTLAALEGPEVYTGPHLAPSEYRTGFRFSRLLRRMLLPAACLLLGGSAATAMWSARADFRRGPEIEPLPVAQHSPKPRRAVSHVGATFRAERNSVAVSPRPVVPRRTIDRPFGHLTASNAAAIDLGPATPEIVPPPSAEGLFAAANRARRATDYTTAMARYRQLRKDFAGSREEITSRVIVGQLALAEERSQQALVEFESYLSVNPNGTLAEEARVGRASALRGLSRADDEREAWLQVLKRHPSSMHADRARARLEQLRQ